MKDMNSWSDNPDVGVLTYSHGSPRQEYKMQTMTLVSTLPLKKGEFVSLENGQRLIILSDYVILNDLEFLCHARLDTNDIETVIKERYFKVYKLIKRV